MATKNPKNPFLVNGYAGPDYFCDRVAETTKLMTALRNERSVVLISPRRMGKTGLIRHTFAQIPAEEAYCIYVDIYRTENLKDLIECLGRAIMGRCGSASARERVMQLLHSLRFSFTTDMITGQPEIGVKMVGDEPETSLAQIFNYMEQADKPVYVAIDEFQQIMHYPEKNVERILRSYIQHLRNVFFIYSGSQKHMMIEMFSSAKRAFYQSAQNMHLSAIAEQPYYQFSHRHLASNGQEIKEETFHFMYESLFAHTWYLQAVLGRVYEYGVKDVTKDVIQQAIGELVDENQYNYQNYCALLATNQLKVLRAIASEHRVENPMSQAFVAKYDLTAASTVRSAIRALMDKEFVYEENGIYSVYDRFFGLWLAQ